MAMLAGPAEMLEMVDGESRTFRVVSWERGEMEIRPRHAPAGKVIDAIRMHVPPEDKAEGAPYWDATAGNLIARLLPMLDMVVASGRRIRVTKRGVPPSARHQVDLL